MYLQAKNCGSENFLERAMNEKVIMASTHQQVWRERVPLLQRVSVEEDHREHYPNHTVRSGANIVYTAQD